MKNSNSELLMISIPNKGSEVRINGINAQCIAHATEAVTPTASQFILKNNLCIQRANIVHAT